MLSEDKELGSETKEVISLSASSSSYTSLYLFFTLRKPSTNLWSKCGLRAFRCFSFELCLRLAVTPGLAKGITSTSCPLIFDICTCHFSRRRRLWPAMGNLLERDHRDSPDPLRPHEGSITERFLCPHGELVVHSRACGVARHDGASSAWRMHRTCNPGRNIYGSEPFTARLSPPVARICNRIWV